MEISSLCAIIETCQELFLARLDGGSVHKIGNICAEILYGLACYPFCYNGRLHCAVLDNGPTITIHEIDDSMTNPKKICLFTYGLLSGMTLHSKNYACIYNNFYIHKAIRVDTNGKFVFYYGDGNNISIAIMDMCGNIQLITHKKNYVGAWRPAPYDNIRNLHYIINYTWKPSTKGVAIGETNVELLTVNIPAICEPYLPSDTRIRNDTIILRFSHEIHIRYVEQPGRYRRVLFGGRIHSAEFVSDNVIVVLNLRDWPERTITATYINLVDETFYHLIHDTEYKKATIVTQ